MRPYCCIASAQEQKPVCVEELICSTTRTWDIQKLERLLLPMDIEAVTQIPISYVRQHDFWAWHYEKSGVFIVRSAYRMIMATKHRGEAFLEGRTKASSTRQEEQNWKKLWKVKVLSKLRIFAWRFTRSSLPTREVRQKRNMVTTAV
jgi:hypothetical protein